MAETEFSIVRFKGDATRSAKVYEGVEALTAEKARKHPAAHPEIIVTSAEKGMGIERLRTAVLESVL